MQFQGIRERSLRTVTATWNIFMWRMLAVLVFGVMLAHWTWIFFAPHAISVLPATFSSSDSQAERLFGNTVSGVAAQAVMPNVRLVGVFAGVPGFAVFEMDGKRQMGLATGREIVAGVELVEVTFDHVVIKRNGVRQQIGLAEKTTALVPPAVSH